MTEQKVEKHSAADRLSTHDENGAMSLRATRCRRDGVITFPPERFGCQKCGAFGNELEEILIPARGTVSASAVVHRHRGPGPPAPFTIASIVLDAGPYVSTLLASGAMPGSRVNGHIERFGDDTFVIFKDVKDAQ